MTDDQLTILRLSLKSGDYNGTDIMGAWIAIDELIALRKTARETAELLEGDYPSTSRFGMAIEKLLVQAGGQYPPRT